MQYNNYGTNIWKSLGDFLLDHYFKNMIEGVPHTRGHTPYLILGWYKKNCRRYSYFRYYIFVKVLYSQRNPLQNDQIQR